MKSILIDSFSKFRPKAFYGLIFCLLLIQACNPDDDDVADEVFTAGTYDTYDSYFSFEQAQRITGLDGINLDIEGDDLQIGLQYYSGGGYSTFYVYTSSDNWEIAMDGSDPLIFSLGDPIYQVDEWRADLVKLSGSSWLFTGETSSYGPYWEYNAPHYLCFRKKEKGKYHHLWVHLKVELNEPTQYLEIYDYALRGAGRN